MKWSEVNYNLDRFTCSVVFDLPPDKLGEPLLFFNIQGEIYCPPRSLPLLKNPYTHKLRVIPPYATVYNLVSPNPPDTYW